MDRYLLLRALNSALDLKRSADRLSAEEVNDLASKLGFEEQETVHIVEEFGREGLLQIHWGGAVSVTAKGRSVLNRRHLSQPHITLGAGAVYIGSGAHVGEGAAVGGGAMAKGATKIQTDAQVGLSEVISELVAVRQHLSNSLKTLPLDAQLASRELADIASHVQNELLTPISTKAALEANLDKATRIIEKLGSMSVAAAKLKPALDMLHRAFGWLSSHLGSIGTWPFIIL